ncbi:hypothetical protein [Saccharothrix australiensis]|uniref:Uncharacterized protein n=1 Tax=Saccharothrix australiensis TaxID=2072 RepID=A0A495W2B1_9PSEU|nr:hypothetical protein [Saccharothrix australiensis]RKT55280.1 hypothetical protein C8E97_3941 [Saccharothrix australiensis]
MSKTAEKEFEGDAAARRDAEHDQGERGSAPESAHEHGELTPLCSGNGCVQTPRRP